MENNNSLLWRLETPESSRPSFVFGTVHVKAPFAFENLDPVLEAIRSCEAFAAELSLDEATQHVNLSNEILANAENQLLGNLSEKKFQKIRAVILRAVNIDIRQHSYLRPMLLMNLLDEAFLPPATAPYALDEYLWQLAKQEGKVMLGLETVDSQAEIMNKLAPKEEIAAFLHQVKNIRKSRQSVLKTIRWYQQEDIQKLYRATHHSLGNWRYVLLKKRNHIMADRIAEIAPQQSVFAAVGAAHLAGKEGVLRLLKLKGFRAIPVARKS